MNSIFLVFGYGVPKNILKDENYNFYLKTVFNKIYDLSAKNKITKPIIIFSGGATDCHKPYKRNEADEMIKLFKVIKGRSFIKTITKNWLLLPERKSISTLENFLYCQDIILKRKIKKANIYIFCEQTRENRIKILSKKIFNKNYSCYVNPIDFDISLNRYLDVDFIAKKEQADLKYALWALQDSKNLEKLHKLFEDKLNYLRKVNPKKHEETIKKYWEMKLKELKKSNLISSIP